VSFFSEAHYCIANEPQISDDRHTLYSYYRDHLNEDLETLVEHIDSFVILEDEESKSNNDSKGSRWVKSIQV